MAIAPVNKFISIAVPVAPGQNKLYEVPTGTSALVLYAQVANVGVNTYPTVTFTQRRKTRSTGNTRDIRIIRDVEIPPNDAVILIDGRMVLEKTPLVIDSLYITGTQTGVTTINDAVYDEPSGTVTVTTAGVHGFSVNSEITIAGIAFTCPDKTAGITTTIFPDPQKSYMVESIVDSVGTSKTFTSIVGTSKGYKHVYNPAVHTFIRSESNSLSKTNLSNATKFTPTGVNYNPKTGIASFTVPNQGLDFITTSPSDDFKPTAAVYDGNVGILTLTKAAHGFLNGKLISIKDGALTFTCDMDGDTNKKTYPRSTDPISGRWISIGNTTTDTFEVDVGKSPFNYYDVSAAEYDPVAGIATLTIGSHDLVAGVTSVRLATQSLTFTCTYDGDAHATPKTYPRANGTEGASGDDPAYNDAVTITSTTNSTISLDVGTANANTGIHTFVPATKLTPTAATYDPVSGILTCTVASHKIETGDAIKIDNGSITFSCDYGCYSGVSSHKSYPRSTDPASGEWLAATKVDANKFKVHVGSTTDLSIHTFQSALAGITRSVVKVGGAYPHTAVPGDFLTGGVQTSSSTLGIATESLVFTCTMDNNLTEHAYPRTTDPAHNTALSITEADCNSVSVDVGISSAGGQVAPLQMEFLASILENSNA